LGVEVKELEEYIGKHWDRLIESSPQATAFHQFDWLKIMEKHTDSQLILLAGFDGEEIFAVVPFFYEEKFGGLFRKLTSPPYPTGVPYLGPVFPHSHRWGKSGWERKSIQFQKGLDKYIRSRVKPHVVSICTSTALRDVRPFLWSGYDALPRYTYISEVSPLSLAWSRVSSSTRRSIRRAEETISEFEQGDQEDYGFLIDSLERRYGEQGIQFDLSKDYLNDVYDQFSPSQLKVFVCRHSESIIGGLITLVYKDTISFWLGGVRPKNSKIDVNAFIFWKTLQWADQREIKYFDLLGANTPSISNFKSKLGFDLKTYFWVEKSSFLYKTATKVLSLYAKWIRL